MPQGHAGAPFVRLMQRVIAGMDSGRMYLGDAILFNRTPSAHVRVFELFLEISKEHKLKLATGKTTIGASRVASLGHSISSTDLRPDLGKLEALTKLPMPSDVS